MAGLSALGRVYPKKTCDVCGQYKHAKPGEFRMVKGRVVCSDHPGYVPVEVADAAPVKTFKVKAVSNARPFSPNDTYEAAEMEIFKFVTDNYRVDLETIRNGSVAQSMDQADFSSGVAGAAWTAIYLYELIVEAKRPRRTVEYARTKLREIANWLLTRQWGAPHNSSVLNNGEHGWGGYSTTGLVLDITDACQFNSEHSAAAGVAMLRAYQLFADSRYLESARATAWFIRSCMCSGKLTTTFTSSDAGGTVRKHMGAVATFTRYLSFLPAHTLTFTFDGAMGMEFLKLFISVAGDEIIGSTEVAVGYSESRQILASVALSEMLNFYKTGTYDSVRGAVVGGLSATTPFQSFASFPSGANTWGWSSGTDPDERNISGEHFAIGIRALRAVEGDSNQVLGLFDWLMSFTANPSNEFEDEDPLRMNSVAGAKEQWLSVKGSYDPTLSLVTALKVQSIATGLATKIDAAGAIYFLNTVGLLASLYSPRQRSSFKRLKDELNVPRPWTRGGDEDGRTFWLGPMARCGLGLQPRSTATTQFRVVMRAAQLGLVYRHAPQAFAERGH